jgi:hypothetical protein
VLLADGLEVAVFGGVKVGEALFSCFAGSWSCAMTPSRTT